MSNDNEYEENSDFNSVDSGFIDTDDTLPMRDSLQQELGPKPPVPFTKTKAFYALVLGSILTLAFLAWLMMKMMGSNEPSTQAIVQPTAEEIAMAEQQEAQAALEAQQALNAPLDPALPPNDFTLSPNPVEALANQSVDGLISEMPEYTVVGNDINMPDGRFVSATDPYIQQALEETRNMVTGYVLENRFLDSRFAEGQEAWFIRSGQGFGDEDYVPIDNPAASTNLRQNMRIYAMEQLRPKLLQAAWTTRGEPIAAIAAAAPQQAPINPSLTEAERDRLLTMIDTQRNNNLELARENQDLRKEQQEVKNKVVNLVQRLEDSPAVSAKLRATMIPESSGWKVSAVVGDRIYLINKDNITVTLSQGDKLPDSNLIISHADESSGIVLVTPSTK